MTPEPSRGRLRRRSLVAALAVGVLVIGGSTISAGAASAATFVGASPQWPSNPDWQRYVQTPSSTDVRPVSIRSVSGDVTGAEALLGTGDGVATLTATPTQLHGSAVTVSFPEVSARYVRLNVSALGLAASNDTGGSYVQLAELQVFGFDASTDLAAGKSVTTSESLENFGWGAHYITDGVLDTENANARGWTTNLHQSRDVSGSPLWATIDLGSTQTVSSVVLWPRTDTLSTNGTTANFPVDYTIQTSATDAQTSSFSVQKTVSGQATPSAPTVTGPASIVLDYGHDVGGYPTFDVTAASGSPTLQAGYSETATQISPTGDGISPWASGDPSRFNTYTVTGPGRITNASIQGGERYEQITLTTPGTVSLSAAGITYTPYIPPADADAGYFVSSSDELNKYWYSGSYTAELNQVPVNSVGARWNTESGALDIPGISGGTGVGLLKTGTDWTDYTASFTTKIVKNQAGWFVRGTDDANGYLIILGSADSTDSAGANVLQQLSVSNGEYHSIGTVHLSTSIASGTWHDITEVVSGTTVTTFVDGTEVASFDSSNFGSGVSAHPKGTIGFREYAPEEAQFSDLTVTAADDAVLYSNPLSADSALADFSIPGANTVPLILDGAKRDRAVWSGDLAVEGPTVYYSSGASDYLKGSIELLGSYAGTNGEVSGTMPPTTPINTAPLPATPSRPYSANYSMYFVQALGDYYTYTGDSDFVKQEWPLVQNQLAYNASLVDGNGLLVTDNSNGADWDYYDGDKTGEVTTYNALYYAVLQQGAKLAAVAGHQDLADQYTATAAALKDAINARLFNASTGLYNLSDTVTDIVAQDANVFAVLFGIAPQDKVAGILSTIKSDLWTAHGTRPFSGSAYSQTISPFVSGFELDARFASGDAANALQLLSDEWGPMIESGDLYTGAFWENIDADGGQPAPNTNMAHGWSTAPTSVLSKYVLGVQPVDAGYATWLVQPHPGDLAWTEGQAPTPHGPLAVDWSNDGDAGFAMKVVAPSGTSGTIAVPTFGKSIDIAVGGTKVWSHGVAVPGAGVTSATLDGDYVELSVGSGTFDISTGSPVTSDQTITFGAISNHIVTAADFHVTATATSGLTVTFAAAGACTVSSSGLVHLTKVGTCTVTASQPGNDQWAAAASVSRSFQVMAATPITRAKVTITGGVTVGSTLTAHTGSWGVTPVALAYAWRLDGKAIAHGTASTLKVVSAYKGHRISVSVTASAPARASVTVTSASVAIPKTLTSTPRPVIHGTASVGHVLSVSTGTWKPSGVHLTYHWYRNGVALKHSVGKTYRVVTADRGVKITVSVTGTKAGYLSVTKTSASKRIAR